MKPHGTQVPPGSRTSSPRGVDRTAPEMLSSLAFHLLADRVALLADVVPIDVFMLVYLGFALNRFLGVPPGWTVLTLIDFVAIVALTTELKCWGGGSACLKPRRRPVH